MALPSKRLGSTYRCASTGRRGELLSITDSNYIMRDAAGTFRSKHVLQPGPAWTKKFVRGIQPGDEVLALEPTFGKEWIRALCVDPKERVVQFLEHAVWKGSQTKVARIRRITAAA